MEALVLAGLLGAGYLINKEEEDKNPITTPVKKEITVPNGENIYNSEHYNETDNLVRSLAKKNFESSQLPESRVINHQKLEPVASNEDEVENYDNYIYSTATGGYIDNNNFMSNDQGVKMAPHFRGAGPSNINFEDTRLLEGLNGPGTKFYQSKKEIPNMFQRQKQNIHGNYFGKGMGDTKRYVNGQRRNNELPFQQEMVRKIDERDPLTRQVGKMIADKSQIDNTRTLNNPKLVNKGKVIQGGSMISTRGKMGMVFQHNPDKFYVNDSDRWLTTNGATIASSRRPKQIMPETNRQVFNKQELGIASNTVTALQKRQNYKKTLKQQLGTDTQRNVGIETPQIGVDMQRGGYRSLPNEREVTEQRDYTSNVASEYKEPTIGLLDSLKKTIKETTINSKQNGHVQNTTIHSTLGLQDNVKITKKQTTINSQNNGYIKGDFEKRSSSYEAPENTTKDTTLFSHTGNSGGFLKEVTLQENFVNADTNPTKEIIARGRMPTKNNVKISNGMDTLTVDIKKLDIDYMNHRLNGPDKVYQEIPSDESCELTTMKDRLDDESLKPEYRIDPELLNPFKDNPYTQSLSSFAY